MRAHRSSLVAAALVAAGLVVTAPASYAVEDAECDQATLDETFSTVRDHEASGEMDLDQAHDWLAQRGEGLGAGVVVAVDTAKGCGTRVLVRHADSLSIYCNLADVTVAVGDRVPMGGRLARIAAPVPGGRAHLHFEVQAAGVHVDPLTRLTRSSSGS